MARRQILLPSTLTKRKKRIFIRKRSPFFLKNSSPSSASTLRDILIKKLPKDCALRRKRLITRLPRQKKKLKNRVTSLSADLRGASMKLGIVGLPNVGKSTLFN